MPCDSTGPFATVPELDFAVTERTGQLPEGLQGTLYRNGPGDRTGAGHYFDGDGYVTAARFGPEGQVHFRSRYVQTGRRQSQQRSGRTLSDRLPLPGFGTRAPLGPLGNHLGRALKGSYANTNAVPMGDALMALCDMDRPIALDPQSLETRGPHDFEGTLSAGMMFSPHPRRCAETGETFNFAQRNALQSKLEVHRLGRGARRLERIAEIDISMVPIHDFALTRNYCIFCLPPLSIPFGGLMKLTAGLVTFSEAFRFDHAGATRIIVVPRNGSAPRFFEAPPWFQFHYAGAHEQQGSLVIDLCRIPDWDLYRDNLSNFRDTDWRVNADTLLQRVRLDLHSGKVERETLSPYFAEFPQVDPRCSARAHRTVYHVTNPEPGEPGLQRAIGRTEVETGDVRLFDFGPGSLVSEPLFAARPGGELDQGWLLCYVYNPARDASDLVVLEAERPDEGPVCTLHLPTNVGSSFHGSWLPERQTA